jgi:hypothetical protein
MPSLFHIGRLNSDNMAELIIERQKVNKTGTAPALILTHFDAERINKWISNKRIDRGGSIKSY